ncbi:hypothetical protein ACHAXT_003313 [Thalassiosira profunda]
MLAFPSSSYALGIFFLVVVSLLWTICSMVVQHLYNDMQFDSPFLIVYIGTSLFSIFLPMRLGYERWGRCLVDSCRVYAECCGCCEGGNGGKDIVAIPWRNEPATASGAYEDEEGLVQSEHDSLHNGVAVEMHSIPHYTSEAGEEGHVDDYSFDNEHCVRNYEPNDPSQSNGRLRSNETTSANYLLSHRDHISMASKVAPLWFFSNYFYAMSLEWTSIASSTVLASMGSIFAFGFATCSRFGDERVTKAKMIGVALCFLGGVATTWTDVGNETNGDGGGAEDLRHLRYLRHPASHLPHIFNLAEDSPMRSLLGDLAGLLSAVGYGAYTVLLRHLCPKDEDRMSMQLLFGYIGVWNLILLLPVAIWVVVSSNAAAESQETNPSEQEPSYEGSTEVVHTTLTWSIFVFLLLKGLLDNVLSDYLWARAVILTSATVASVGVGLTIPMAFAADWIMGNGHSTQAGEVLGAISVLLGFVFVNLDGGKGSSDDEEVTFGEDDDGLGTNHSAHDDVDAEILS